MMKKRTLILIILLVSVLTACTARMPAGDDPTAQPNPEEENSFVLPDDIRVGTNGVPVLQVYVTDDREIHEMDLEETAIRHLWMMPNGIRSLLPSR